MTDTDLLRKKLAAIETYVAQLRSLARPELIGQDLREERFVEHTLQLGIQAALDVASHLVSDLRLGEPRTNRELFALLVRHGWIAGALGERLQLMAGFRNLLVHGYDEVDLAIVREITESHLGDLLGFAAAVRARVDAEP